MKEGLPPLSSTGFLSLKHAADWADVSPKTIKRWLIQGLQYFQANPKGKILIRPCDIQAFLNQNQTCQFNLEATINKTLIEIGL